MRASVQLLLDHHSTQDAQPVYWVLSGSTYHRIFSVLRRLPRRCRAVPGRLVVDDRGIATLRATGLQVEPGYLDSVAPAALHAVTFAFAVDWLPVEAPREQDLAN
jgi:hypothetical protein